MTTEIVYRIEHIAPLTEDVTVYLQGGVDGGTVDALLAALQQR